MKILMVCLGNICRSPMAEGILRKKIEERGLNITVDSVGTSAWHAGEPPDNRAINTAKKFGADISTLKARKFSKKDFDDFDKIYVMDLDNLRDVLSLARTDEDAGKVKLLLSVYGDENEGEVPDPWFGTDQEFVDVFKMLDNACDELLKKLN